MCKVFGGCVFALFFLVAVVLALVTFGAEVAIDGDLRVFGVVCDGGWIERMFAIFVGVR